MSGHAWHDAVVGEKKAQIVEAARSLFLEQGYARATMSSLAERAGVSPTTLYKHYPEKDALFAAVLEALAHRFASELDKADSAKAALPSRLEAFGLRYAALLSEPETIALQRLIIAEAPLFPRVAQRFLAAIKGPVFHRLAEIIQGAIDSGHLRPHPPSDSMGQFLGYIERSVLLPKLLSPEHKSDARNDAYVVRLGVQTLLTVYSRPRRNRVRL